MCDLLYSAANSTQLEDDFWITIIMMTRIIHSLSSKGAVWGGVGAGLQVMSELGEKDGEGRRRREEVEELGPGGLRERPFSPESGRPNGRGFEWCEDTLGPYRKKMGVRGSHLGPRLTIWWCFWRKGKEAPACARIKKVVGVEYSGRAAMECTPCLEPLPGPLLNGQLWLSPDGLSIILNSTGSTGTAGCILLQRTSGVRRELAPWNWDFRRQILPLRGWVPSLCLWAPGTHSHSHQEGRISKQTPSCRGGMGSGSGGACGHAVRIAGQT